ncbi:MAG: PLP-dependent aspartate aminotransferase family protein [Thermaerobacter sp.]|nr:PLP-dependent aspartate aminotransferase family protein [Thermaerobacter sp.]
MPEQSDQTPRPDPDTRFIHSPADPDAAYHAVMPPVYRATTFHQPDPWESGAYDYGRSGNPTRHAFEEAMASLEGGQRGLAFASGNAALTAFFLLFGAGDHLVVTEDCQGGTQRILRGVFRRFGLSVTYADTSRLDQVQAAVRPETRAILVENFSNPFLWVTDIPALADWAHGQGLLLAVDNTFVTPYLQNPLKLGADLVLHSATKMISGHSDLTGGIAVARDRELAARLYFIQNSCGAILSPDDAYQAHRGLKTLPVRMRQAAASALALAGQLSDLPAVEAVYYPGLPSHPGHAVACATMRGFGQMVTFRLRDPAWIPDLVQHLRWARVGAGLGGTETIVSLPELHCHAALTPDERRARHITSDVIRVSVGLETAQDILDDLLGAIRRAAS